MLFSTIMSLPGVFDPVDDSSFSEHSRMRFLAEGRRRVLGSFKILVFFSCLIFPLFSVVDYFEYPALREVPESSFHLCRLHVGDPLHLP